MGKQRRAGPQSKTAFFLAVTSLFAMATFAVNAVAQNYAPPAPEPDPQSDRNAEPGITAPLEPVPPGITGDRVFSEMVARNEIRSRALLEYSALRTYEVLDSKGRVHAQEIGRMEYRAPDTKSFAITSEEGSGLIRRLALSPLISSEIETAAGKEHRDSSITPANYTFHLLGEQQVGPYRCFVVQATPRREDKYLFAGKVWIDAQDYAVVRIEGHPAKKLSFWIERADFVRKYEKVDGFWLPQRDETSVQVRFYGKNVLIIDHQDYVVNPASEKVAAVHPVRTY